MGRNVPSRFDELVGWQVGNLFGVICGNVESTFSAIKRKFGDSVRSKTDAAMKNEVLCKILAHNLTCLIQEQETLGIAPIFWKEDQLEARAVGELNGMKTS